MREWEWTGLMLIKVLNKCWNLWKVNEVCKRCFSNQSVLVMYNFLSNQKDSTVAFIFEVIFTIALTLLWAIIWSLYGHFFLLYIFCHIQIMKNDVFCYNISCVNVSEIRIFHLLHLFIRYTKYQYLYWK